MTQPFARTMDGHELKLDIERLLTSRMLIQANSGGGKTYILRKLLETTHGKVQHIVIDPEGEFATLREKYDYILAGKEGDIPADPRSASLLARKVLELGSSIIIDLYELKPQERIRFVRLFCEAVVNAPKAFWNPCFIVIDEIQMFCPEKGEAESANAVIDLATRGRKRGYCIIGATLRISMLNKNTAAQLLNKLIGRTGQDIDQKRAGEELGFTTKQQILSLRDLEPGQFYAFGPALSKNVVQVQIGEVETTHLTAGSGQAAAAKPPVPTEKVRKVLARLTDLPKEAEKELRTIEDYKQEIRKLRVEIRSKPAAKLDDGVLKNLQKHSFERGWKEAEKQATPIIRQLEATMKGYRRRCEAAAAALGSHLEKDLPPDVKIKMNPIGFVAPHDLTIHVTEPAPRAKVELKPVELPDDLQFGTQERMILAFLKLRPDVYFNKPQIGAMTNYSATSGTFKGALSKLTKANLIQQRGTEYGMTELDAAGELVATLTAKIELPTLRDWLSKLPEQTKKIYQVLYDHSMQTFTKESLADETGYRATSGSFKSSIINLLTLGLAERDGDGVRFNTNLQEYA